MIRVLQVITRLVVRGVPRHVLELAAGLDRDRFSVDVAAGRGEPGEGTLWPEAATRGLRPMLVPALQRAVSPSADARALVSLYALMRRGRYQIVHTHISKAGVLGRLAARLAGVPVVLHTYHGPVAEVEAGGVAGAAFRLAERTMARLSDRLVAVSADTARRSLDMGLGRPSQYCVIHNGIDLARFVGWEGPRPAGLPAGAAVIGAVGTLTAEKSLDVLLAAAARLRARLPEMHLVLVGDGPLRRRLETQAAVLGLGPRVQFTGLVADVRPWLGHVDVLVTPSRREGLPMVLLEALAMRRPVVATRVGGIPEIIEDGANGILVPPGDAAALAEALLRLLADRELRERMGNHGRQAVVERFGLAAMLRRTEALYEELLAERCGRR